MRTYAIGDIHGHLDKLEEAHRRIADDRARTGDADAPVVHIGDLVDRGPDSRAVIAYLMRGHEVGQPWVTLKGNHDRMFTGFMADADSRDPGLRAELHWVHPRLGGGTTLASYGVERAEDRLLFDLHAEAASKVPEAHLGFLRDLPTTYVRGGVLFVHAGIRPGIPLTEQSEDDLLWIRRDFHDHEGDHGYLVVHGHTPVDAVTHYGNRVNIDSGAGYGHALSTIVIEDGKVWLLDGFGREAIRPGGS
ncbi:MAG: metallophosphoesterase family protein [Albidovulum sp.]|uniref:metallophosphoesterase family protein n=1 Tax=Albidovulum sp. TaxID=1872424 RepID=UPI003CA7A9AC